MFLFFLVTKHHPVPTQQFQHFTVRPGTGVDLARCQMSDMQLSGSD